MYKHNIKRNCFLCSAELHRNTCNYVGRTWLLNHTKNFNISYEKFNHFLDLFVFSPICENCELEPFKDVKAFNSILFKHSLGLL